MNTTEELQKEIEKKFLCPDRFAREIELLVSKRDDLNYITAITEYCEINSIDLESVPKLISKTLRDRIQGDATKLNFLKRTSRARLPL